MIETTFTICSRIRYWKTYKLPDISTKFISKWISPDRKGTHSDHPVHAIRHENLTSTHVLRHTDLSLSLESIVAHTTLLWDLCTHTRDVCHTTGWLTGSYRAIHLIWPLWAVVGWGEKKHITQTSEDIYR